MTFNYMVYMFCTRKGYFFAILSALLCKSCRLTEMHKLSRKRRWFTCFIVSSSICSGVASRMTLRSFCDLEVIRYHLKLLHAKLYRHRVNGLRVTWYAYDLFAWGGYPRMGYIYVSIYNSNRLHSSFRFVRGITSQGQLSFIGWARAAGPACLKQTLLRAWWTD